MNGLQRGVLTVGLVLVLLTALVPPWRGHFYHQGQQYQAGFQGYRPVWQPTVVNKIVLEIDYSRLMMQWLLILLLVWGGLLLTREPRLHQPALRQLHGRD